MQYLGGKTRIAKQLAEVIDRTRKPGQLVWDAFCGGLSMSVALSKNGPVWSTDVNAALINLYLAVQQGWVPPSEVSREQYAAAKLLPDTDPLKAFCGFGCSFGGMWFGAYRTPYQECVVSRGPEKGAVKRMWPHRAAREGLLSDVPICKSFGLVNFLLCEPQLFDVVLYLDPPYKGTSGYKAVAPFDYALFVERCAQWSRFCDVFVSEYSFQLGECVWERSLRVGLNGAKTGTGVRATERLYHLPKGSKW